MKLAYISSSTIPSRTANSIHVMKMCQAFAKEGHDVVLFTPDKKVGVEENISDIFDFYDVEECFQVKKNLWLSVAGSGYIYGFITGLKARFWRSDLVFCRNFLGAFFAAHFGCTVVFESHSPIEDAGHLKQWLFRKLINHKNFISLVVITTALKEHYAATFPEVINKMVISPDAADPISLDSTPIIFANSGKKLQVGYIGHLYKGRGIELIEHLAHATSEWADFHIIGGTKTDIETCNQRTKYLKNFHLHGFKQYKEAERFRMGCDVLLAPYSTKVTVSGDGGDTSRWMSPLKIFEYMAAGKPIICSNITVLREVLQHNFNAILCEHNRQDIWLNELEKLRDNKDFRNYIGENALNDFQRQYTWQARSKYLLASIF